MKLLLMIILLVPVLIFQLFMLSDSIALCMKTKKPKLNNNNIRFRDERTPRKTSFRVVK